MMSGTVAREYQSSGCGIPTQEDPIGLAGGLNLYGYGNGDALNNTDPFGLTVRFEGAAAQKFFERLQWEARRAERSKDAEVSAAGKALSGLLTQMQEDPDVTYVIQIGRWNNASLLEEHGGGLGYCSQGTCNISIATDRGYPLAGILTTLAHESGGAVEDAAGRDHYDPLPGGAVGWENKARQIFGCTPRASHAERPARCK